MIAKFFQTRILIILLLLLTLPTFWSLLRPGFFPMQDDLQAFRLFEMDKCFQDMQIPCRWVPDMGYEYGYPQFNFYGPSVFYIGEIFHLVGMQFIDVIKLLFVLGFLISVLSAFLFLRPIFGKFPAFVGSLLFTYAPFKAAEVYVRGSLNEFWAVCFFPIPFWASYQLIQTRKKRYAVYLALSVGFLLVTHNLMSMLILPILALWSLVLLGTEKKWKLITWLAASAILGIGISAFYVFPLILEKQYVHTETLLSGYFDYRQHFVPIQKLFLSNEWGYGSSNLGQTETLNLSTGILQWILGLIGFIGAILFYKKEKKTSMLMLFIGIIELLVLFMMHQKSSFIWSSLPILAWLQFPWRFLGVSSFLLSFLGAGAIYFIQKYPKFGLKLGFGLGIIAIIVSVSLTITFYHPKDWLNITDKVKFSGASLEKQLTISIFDYLPIYAKLPPNKKAPDSPEILEGDAQVLSYKKGSDYQEANISVSGGAVVRLPLFDFPGMKVFATTPYIGLSNNLVSTREIDHINTDCRGEEYCLGLITFSLPPNASGTNIIRAQLTDTPVRVIGNSISLISLLVLVGGSVFLYKKR